MNHEAADNTTQRHQRENREGLEAAIEVKPHAMGDVFDPTTPVLPTIGPTRVPHAAWMLAMSALGLAAAWAFWPLQERLSKSEMSAESPTPDADALPFVASAPFDLDAFRVPIWVTPPPPPPPPPIAQATPPQPPLKLQLLAISRDAGAPGEPAVLRATLYDPETDRLLIVAHGDTIGTRRVESLTEQAVALAGPDGQHKLSLTAIPANGASPGPQSRRPR